MSLRYHTTGANNIGIRENRRPNKPSIPEEWKPVPSLPGVEASTLGRLRSGGRVLPTHKDKNGYYLVRALGKTRRAHRLVCEAFHGPPPTGKPWCAHYDGNESHNNPSNLRWASPKENSDDMLRHGTRSMGETFPRSVLTEAQVKEIWLSPLSQAKIAAKFGCSSCAIWNIRGRKTWSHFTCDLPPQPARRRKTKIPIPDEAVRMFDEGATQQAVADTFGVSTTTSFRWDKQRRGGQHGRKTRP